MSFTLKASGQGAITATDPFSITLPSSYHTVAGDCIIVAVGNNGASQVSGGSGCGATWTVPSPTSNVPPVALAIGYGCTAGGTSVSLSGNGGVAGDYVIAVFSGVLAASTPLIRYFYTNVNASSVTTGTAQSYAAGDLLVCMTAASTTGSDFTSVTWSNGSTTNEVGFSATADLTRMDYVVAGSASSTTVTSTPSGSHRLSQILAVLAPVPTAGGNMLLVMGQ